MTLTAPVITLPKKILLVEDEALIAMDLKERLQSLGYSVSSVARTADEALRFAVSQPPDLILMDIQLSGGKDGIHAADEIRKTLDVPVVYLTAHSDSFTLERAKIVGPFGYITKPFVTATLRAQIEMALSKHQTEQKLRQSEAWLSATLRSIGDAVIATDCNGRVEFMNIVAEELTGWNINTAAGELAAEVFRVLDPRTAEPVANPVLAVLSPGSTRTFSGEYSLQSPGGSLALVQTVISANRTQDGQLLGAVIVFRDITRQRELEQRAQEFQNMETIAVMAGGLAHDFNNLLTIILGYADLARSEHQKAADALAEIRGAGESAAVLCRHLLTISRKDAVQAEIFDLNEPIVASSKMLRQILGHGCALVEKCCSESLSIASDRTQIQQVLINLAMNARDAMPNGGTFTIGTHRNEAGLAEIEVTDTGIGMTEETRRGIFKPFFSRKGGRGTGLGMTIVHSIVTKWSGTIEVKSEPGRGTEFRISFPLSKISAESQNRINDSPVESIARTVTGNILLVEDDAAIRGLMREQLEPSGSRIFEASSGEEALLFPGRHEETIDLLITDVMMPGMTGPELAKQWVARCPETQVLFMSGYSQEELKDNDLLKSGRAEFLAKPVKPDHLTATAVRMLARKKHSELTGTTK